MAAAAGQTSVVGLVLAAGRSARMGEPKPLLELDGRTFVEAAVEALREGGCREVIAVIASADAAFAARSAGATIARGQPDGEQIDSLRAGLDATPDFTAAVVVLPVDHPRVRAETVAELIGVWRAQPDAIVRPVHDGRPGHPTIFPHRTWLALRDPQLEHGARSVVERERAVDVDVDDPGVLIDIDTPEDLREQERP